jgi:threonine/homoserine efflux transporter RhtA
MSSLPVPVVGVFAGMIVLGERPGSAEWLALVFVIGSLVAVLWPTRTTPKEAPLSPSE